MTTARAMDDKSQKEAETAAAVMNSGRWRRQHNNDGNDNSDNGNNDGNDDCGGSGGSDNDGDSGQQQRWSPGEAEVQRSANMAAFNNQ